MDRSYQMMDIPRQLTDVQYYILMAILNTPRYSIGIFEEVAERSKKRYVLKPEELFTNLKQLYSMGWIATVQPTGVVESARHQRVLFRTTSTGREMIEERVRWMEDEVRIARTELQQN